ncbi:MAG: hypothetical protein KGJ60_01840 [Verrucomicrobiota bacterium]|nr:hypothetical protein [Verrucomicrobiota bacterium]
MVLANARIESDVLDRISVRLLREPRPQARRRLRQARLPEELAGYEAELAGPCPFRAPALESLLGRIGVLPDSRRGHGCVLGNGLSWPARRSAR